jgi:hypothetical protein
MAISDTDDDALSPAQAHFLARARRLMLISGTATVLGIAVVVSVIGYRLFAGEGSPADMLTVLPKGARVLSTAVAGDRVVVTLDVGDGAVEIRTYDARSLRPQGRLRFAVEP